MQRIGMAIGGYLITALEGITGGGAVLYNENNTYLIEIFKKLS